MTIISIELNCKPVPYVRVTQRSKYYNTQYQRYCDFKQFLQYNFIANKENTKTAKQYYNNDFMLFLKIEGKTRADIDNIEKGVLDALNKIAYVDDRNCVATIKSKNKYSKNNKTHIKIIYIPKDNEIDFLKKLNNKINELF
jgi:Holliday junction resolvase RusA-like endonuclease